MKGLSWVASAHGGLPRARLLLSPGGSTDVVRRMLRVTAGYPRAPSRALREPPFAFPAQIPDTLSNEEQYAADTLALYTGDMGGANHLQGTKPETIGFALADSPAGQAAWIYDKFQSKTDNDGLAEDALSTDEMLDAISLYWLTNSAASSAPSTGRTRAAAWPAPN